MSSANRFNLDQSKILSSGNRLRIESFCLGMPFLSVTEALQLKGAYSEQKCIKLYLKRSHMYQRRHI